MVSQEFWRKDGPYSWVILVTIVVSRVAGITFAITTTGVLADEYPRLFNVEQAQTNIIPSTLLCVLMFSVPVNTMLMKVIGVRKISLIGTIITLIGIVPSTFASKIWHLVISYSIVSGLGMSMNMAATLGIVRHYFEKRQGAAFACIGLGSGLGQVTYPAVLAIILAQSGYKLSMFYMSPIFLLNILPPILFVEQIPLERPESAKVLFKSYACSFKRYITSFFLLNAFFARGAQLGLLVLLFSHVSNGIDNQTAVIAYSIFGIGVFVSNLILTMYLLKFKLNCFVAQIVFNIVIGTSACFIAGFNKHLVYYVGCAVFGLAHGGTLAIKGALSIHVYPTEAVDHSYAISEAFGGIGSLIFPLAGGYLQKFYGSSAGMYLLGILAVVGGLFFVLAALIRPHFWIPYQKRKQVAAHTQTQEVKEDDKTEYFLEDNKQEDASV